MLKTFVTLFNSKNVHMIKDVGLIPFGMYYCGYYDSYIATYENEKLSYLNNRVKGLKLWKIEKLIGIFIFDAVLFLIKNAKKIDVLNLYHTSSRSAVFALCYKFLNPKGILYVKLDGGYTREETPWYKSFRRIVIKKADLLTTELEQKRQELCKSWKCAVYLLRNPCHPSDIKLFIPYSKRENIIITVGRLGTAQKNTEILLEAFQKVADKLSDWNLYLVGPVTPSFQYYLNDYFNSYPDLCNRIVLLGNITNRDQLMELYGKAKVFVFPSRVESYGIALMEAGISGTYIICSEIPASKELTNNFKFAAHFPADDKDALASEIIKSCNCEKDIETIGINERNYLINICSIDIISQTLNQLLKECKTVCITKKGAMHGCDQQI